MSANPEIEFRLKAKRKDGAQIPYQKRDGSTAAANRVTIGTVFNRDGKRGVQLEGPVADAVAKALGGPNMTSKDFYFDLFAEQDSPTQVAAKDAAKDAW